MKKKSYPFLRLFTVSYGVMTLIRCPCMNPIHTAKKKKKHFTFIHVHCSVFCVHNHKRKWRLEGGAVLDNPMLISLISAHNQ